RARRVARRGRCPHRRRARALSGARGRERRVSHLRILRLEADLAELRGWLGRGGARYVNVLETRGMPPSTYRLALAAPGVEDVARDWLTPAGRRRVGPF